MPRPLEQAVVVVTGASSGIGRAAALRIARRGGSLALCARSEEPLAEVAAECEGAGASVLHRTLNVGEEEAVEAFAAEVEECFGRIDVWVNDAATMAYGTFDDIPSEVFCGVVETNLMGQVHGARSALRRFRRQGAGVLINMSSIWGRIPSPQVTPYVVSKHAVRAFTECLQAELADEPEIHVTALTPQAVDTPIFEHAGNYTGRQVRPIPPVLDPEKVAAGIEACAENPKPQVSYGLLGRGLELLHAAAPPLYRRIAHSAFIDGTRGQSPADPAAGNVLGSTGPHRVGGDWRARRRGALGRAFSAAAGGAFFGLFGKGS